jgi:hypothetical protein
MYMKAIEIIEDARPYYIRFKINPESFSLINAICNHEMSLREFARSFTSYELSHTSIMELISITNRLFKVLDFRRRRVNLFISQPGYYGIPHKDSADMKFGINFVLEAKDNKCVTNWYTDESMIGQQCFDGHVYNGYGGLRATREVQNYTYGTVKPSKSMVAVEGECILFNVNMYHDWFNDSPNRRTVLTLRPVDGSHVTYQDAVDWLFKDLL